MKNVVFKKLKIAALINNNRVEARLKRVLAILWKAAYGLSNHSVDDLYLDLFKRMFDREITDR